MAQPSMRISATVMGAPDPRVLAAFYQRLLGWTVGAAIDAGATLAAFQPQDGVRVMLDPVGHPFCLFQG